MHQHHGDVLGERLALGPSVEEIALECGAEWAFDAMHPGEHHENSARSRRTHVGDVDGEPLVVRPPSLERQRLEGDARRGCGPAKALAALVVGQRQGGIDAEVRGGRHLTGHGQRARMVICWRLVMV